MILTTIKRKDLGKKRGRVVRKWRGPGDDSAKKRLAVELVNFISPPKSDHNTMIKFFDGKERHG